MLADETVIPLSCCVRSSHARTMRQRRTDARMPRSVASAVALPGRSSPSLFRFVEYRLATLIQPA